MPVESAQFRFIRAACLANLKGSLGLMLAKAALVLTKTAALRITLNIDDTPIGSRSHTHPSHSQLVTSRLLTSSLSVFQFTPILLH